MIETEDDGHWIDKAEEERLKIISRYDKGRDVGAQPIDPWEDPAFEIYHVTDYYGFIHDNRLPLAGADEIKKKNHGDVDRIDKWLKMHKGWEKYKNSEKLKKRVYKGIPNRLRGLVWSLLLELEPLQNQQKGKYQEMYELARKYSPDIRQIDLDVNRTFRDHINFRERYGVKQKSLFNILSAYSIYNSEVGYCQGMSQIAALLLLYLNEEEAFWAFAQLMTHHRYAMHGFFKAGFPKLIRFQSHHDRVLSIMLPKLKKHFDKNYVDAGLYTLKWFFQCFLDRVPYELALRYWDIYLLEGEKVLVCGAYAILKMHNKSLLGKRNMDDILNYLQSKLPSNFDCDTDTAIKFFGNCVEELHRKKLDTAGEPGDDELVKKPFGVIDLPTPTLFRKHPPPTTASKISNSNDSSTKPIDVTTEDNLSTQNEEPVQIVAETSVPTLPTSPEFIIQDNSSHTSHVINTEEESSLPTNSGPNYSLAPRVNTSEIIENNSSSKLRSSPSPQPINSVQSNRPPPPPVSPRKIKKVDSINVVAENSHIRESIQTTNDVVEHSSTSTSRRIPPSVSPRRMVVENNSKSNVSSHRQTIDVLENSSSRSRSTAPSPSVNIPPSTSSLSNIPSSEAVRINMTSTASTHHNFESTVSTTTVKGNRFDLNKSDPNRIKIDVTAGMVES